MKYIKKTGWMLTLLASIFIIACVTINIYFPTEKVESVAEDIVNEIREKSGEKDQTTKNSSESFISKTLLAFFCSPAWAEDATTVSNPTINALKEKIINRHKSWKPYYDKGMIKEGDDGYVSLGNTSGMSLKDKRNVKNLINAENKDRQDLYTEVAKALKIDASQVHKIAELFAKNWQGK